MSCVSLIGHQMLRRGLVLLAYCLTVFMSGCNSSERELSTMVQKLTDTARQKKAFCYSGLSEKGLLAATDVPQSLVYISSNKDYSSFFLVLIMRREYPEAYAKLTNDTKSQVLCSALGNVECLNDWGWLDKGESFDDEAAKALVETGKNALKWLAPILKDEKEAPLFGSEAATLSSSYKYRRKDFAYRYASLILGESPVFHADPKERDKDIEALKTKLK